MQKGRQGKLVLLLLGRPTRQVVSDGDRQQGFGSPRQHSEDGFKKEDLGDQSMAKHVEQEAGSVSAES